jgi:cyclohexanecarboxylate-CoA ligase
MNDGGVAKANDPTLWELTVSRADRSPDAMLAVSPDDSEVTFAELRERATDAAAWLLRRGVRPGESVVWQLPTGLDAIILAVALSRLGTVQIPILPFLGEKEMGHVLAQTGAQTLVVPIGWGQGTHDLRDYVAREFGRVNVVEMAPETPGTNVAEAVAADVSHVSHPGSHSWVFYTSGTTAAPKGTRHCDATLGACARAMVERYEVTPSDRMSFVFQITHIGGIAWIYATLMSGCGLILVEKFDREATWLLRRHGVTLAGAGLPFMHEYLSAQRTLPEGERLFPRVRAFTFGGMPKPPSIHYAMKEACGGAGVLGAYGMTEAPILTAAGPGLSDEELAHTEGPPMPGVELKVVGSSGGRVAEGEAGELRVKAPQVMLGYLDAALDAAAFDGEGFLRTGDLGRVDPHGNVIITGRLKDVIIRKGENVSAKEVEDALFTHPAIRDVAVIGLPDAVRGEMVCAVVVSDDDGLDVAALAEFLVHFGLMRQKMPEQVELVASLPRSDSGKVDKKALQRHFGS